MAESGSLASIIVTISADASEFLSGLKKASDQAKQFAEAGAVLTAAGGAVLGSLTAMTEHAATFGAEVYGMQQRTGLAVDTIAGLKQAADASGKSLDDFTTGFRKLASAAEGAANGNKAQVELFERLGITVTDSSGHLKSLNTLLPEVADALSHMGNSTELAATAAEVFGKGGLALLPILKGGSEGLQKWSEDAKAAGVSVTESQAAQARAFQLAQHDIEDALEGVTVSVGNVFIPALTEIATSIKEMLNPVHEWIDAHPKLIQYIGEAALALTGSGGLLLAIGGALAIMPLMSAAVATLGGDLVIMTGGLSLVVPLVYTFRKEIEAAILQFDSWITGTLSKAIDVIAKTAGALGAGGLASKLMEVSDSLKATSDETADWTNNILAGKDGATAARLAIEPLKVAVDDAGESHSKASKAVKAHQEAVAALLDQINGESKGQLALADAVTQAVEAHIPMRAIVVALGPQIEKLVQQWEDEGKAIPAAVQQVYAAQKAHEEFSNSIKDANAFKLNLSGYNSDMDRLQARIHDSQTAFEYLRATLAAPIMPVGETPFDGIDFGAIKFNDDISHLVINLGILKEKAPEAIGVVTTGLNASAIAFDKAWSTAMGNVTSGIAQGFSRAIIEAQSLRDAMTSVARQAAEGMLSAFITGLITPLTQQLSGIGKSIGDLLSGSKSAVSGGGGGGIFGGALSGILGPVGLAVGAFGIVSSLFGKKTEPAPTPAPVYSSSGFNYGFGSTEPSVPYSYQPGATGYNPNTGTYQATGQPSSGATPAAAGDMNVTINVNGNGKSDAELAATIAQELNNLSLLQGMQYQVSR